MILCLNLYDFVVKTTWTDLCVWLYLAYPLASSWETQMASRLGQQQMCQIHFFSSRVMLIPIENPWHCILLNNVHQAYGTIFYDRKCWIIQANAFLMSVAHTGLHGGHLLWRDPVYVSVLFCKVRRNQWQIKHFHQHQAFLFSFFYSYLIVIYQTNIIVETAIIFYKLNNRFDLWSTYY